MESDTTNKKIKCCAAGIGLCQAPFISLERVTHRCKDCGDKVHTHCLGINDDGIMTCAKCHGSIGSCAIPPVIPDWYKAMTKSDKSTPTPKSSTPTRTIATFSHLTNLATSFIPPLKRKYDDETSKTDANIDENTADSSKYIMNMDKNATNAKPNTNNMEYQI